MEYGKLQYGIGVTSKIRVVLDRSTGDESISIKSLSYIQIFNLLRTICYTLQNNYPDVVYCAYVVPVGAVFRGIYSLFSHLMRPASRKKVVLVGEKEDNIWWSSDIDATLIPRQLGGEHDYTAV
jgi:CRAL/TRIO domain